MKEIPDELYRVLGLVVAMRHPSVAKLLRQRAYEYEAKVMDDLVREWDRFQKEQSTPTIYADGRRDA